MELRFYLLKEIVDYLLLFLFLSKVGSCYAAHSGLQLTALLPPPPKYRTIDLTNTVSAILEFLYYIFGSMKKKLNIFET